ncbi:glycogen synthase kinase binding protein [Chiloscyllium plagiosum]|uniref:glycogen synthase kinase binding protein n=1 Tax=Chiloscyllium plagiosum TaxID=36176 RepID=UPI001CB80DA8|nr:glycogen synthase kinase binding protein [Chiloscyllium plagiosum]
MSSTERETRQKERALSTTGSTETTGKIKMPRRRESFLLLEQAVTADSKEIDALVAKIGETLQFQRMPHGTKQQQQQQQQQHQQQQSQQLQYQQRLYPQHQQEPRVSAKCGLCCIERWKVPSRNKPYSVPHRLREAAANPAKSSQHTMRPSPECGPRQPAHQKLEQLLSSGNLIKEAVRRLHSRHHYAHIYSEKLTL